ncbi:MAG: hypothetical protein WCF67_19440 [Chitinophagaceae bacterium]
MASVEIHYNKALTILFLIALLVLALSMNYFAFIVGGSTLLKIITLAVNIYVVYDFYGLVKQIRENKPAIVLSEQTIELYKKGKPSCYAWNEIEKIYVEQDEGSSYLIIHANGAKKKFGLGFLEKNPAEIYSLINTYKK